MQLRIFVLSVYLQTSPEVCYERLKRRCREEEKIIPLVKSSFYICGYNKIQKHNLSSLNTQIVTSVY